MELITVSYSRACFVPSVPNRWNSFLWLASTEPPRLPRFFRFWWPVGHQNMKNRGKRALVKAKFPARAFFHGIHRLTGCRMLLYCDCSVATARLGPYRDGASVVLLLLCPAYDWQFGHFNMRTCHILLFVSAPYVLYLHTFLVSAIQPNVAQTPCPCT